MIYDCIVIGAGLVGLSTAYHLKVKHPEARMLLLEKEEGVSRHQSGHNSGVIHSGIYYKPGSEKARNCITGYSSIIEFAEKYGISYDLCGKIIVATNPAEVPLLENIYRRGTENGLHGLQYLSREEFREIEPHCEGVKAIRVPQTGIIDFPAVAEKLLELFVEMGGEVLFNHTVTGTTDRGPITVHTQRGDFTARRMVACAGLYSDKIAQMSQPEKDFIIVPFRGEYYKIKESKKHLVNHLIYPVPDPNFPFLGVHFTRMVDGNIEAGPNAVLAFKREGYKFSDFNLGESLETLTYPGFWKIAAKYGKTGMGEIYRSLSKSAFTRALQKLIPEIQEADLMPGGAGVRAQALKKDGSLIDDFDIMQKGHVVHVRNAPSPAATSCLSIGDTISSMITI